eukprot:1194065-Prorocentrum_minimum.AAC.1
MNTREQLNSTTKRNKNDPTLASGPANDALPGRGGVTDASPSATAALRASDTSVTLRACESTLRASECTLRASESTLRASESTLRASESILRASESTLRASESTLRA